MSNTVHPILEQYMRLTDFLGRVLGPDYEVALHDLTREDRCIIAIANNHVSGREIGAPLTNMALGILRDKSYETADYRLHYYGLSVNGKELRSSTFFIKSEGELLGLLCINFDDSRYRELSTRLLGLCHPDQFVADTMPVVMENGETVTGFRPVQESFRNSTEAVAADAIQQELNSMGVAAERLTSDERLQIIMALEKGGIFLLKGAVKDVAAGLHCSQASVYRYLTQIKNMETDS